MPNWKESPTPGGWEYRSEEHEATIAVDYIMPSRSGLDAWVELKADGLDVPVASGQQNLMRVGATAPFLRDVGESHVPWAEGLRFAFFSVVTAWREGAATVDLATIEPGDQMFLLDPFVQQGMAVTRLIAPGGSGKSIFAMAIALSVALDTHRLLGVGPQESGPVLYLDWEADKDTHARRIRALCEPVKLEPPGRDLILYRNESNPLSRSMQTVRRTADRIGAVMVVVDSAKMAAGSSGLSSGEDSTLGMFAALREIGRPAVVVDHKSKEDIRKDKRGGYGSIFNQNLARMEWEYTRYSRVSRNERQFVISLEKENNVGEQPPVAYKMLTEGGKTGISRCTFTQISPDSVVDPSADTVPQKILALFVTSTEPMSVRRIAEITSTSESSIRSTLHKDDRFFNVNGGVRGKPGLWRPTEEALTERLDDGYQDELPAEDEGPVSDWREGDDVF